MTVLFTDYKQSNLNLEFEMLAAAGIQARGAQCCSPAEVIREGQGARVLVANGAPITRAVFEALPELALVSAVGIGVDHIDTAAAKDHGVWVANVPDANVNEVSCHALAMALSLIRHLPAYDRSVRAGNWDKRATGPLARPSSLNLGILGLGHIGKALGQLAQPIFKRILAHDPYCAEEAWPVYAEPVALENLFAHADVVSIHVPLTKDTHNLINGSLLGQMCGGYLVNTSRGPIVSESALMAALDSGALAGAALDVLPQEPPPPDSRILQHPGILLSPHAAFYSLDAEEALRRGAVENVIEWMKQGKAKHAVVVGDMDQCPS